MKIKFSQLALLLFAIITLAGCQEQENDPINPLTAHAGEETAGFVGYSTILDGSLSANSTGKPFTYKWEVTSRPTGATVTIEGQEEVLAKFYGSLPGEYTVKLTISYLTWQDTDTVILTLTADAEPSLLAVAGEDRFQEIGGAMALNGSASVLNGASVQILWENVSKPENSTVTIQNPSLLETSFNPSIAGEYLFKLSLTSGVLKSQDLVKITVLEGGSNQGPIIINADILQDRTLTNVFVTESDKLDYLVTKDVAVRGAKLTIEPGVRIGFEEGTGLTIAENGSMKAYTLLVDTSPIVFQGKEAQKGYWDGIQILSQNPAEYISGIVIRDAGKLGYGLKVGSGSKLYLTLSQIEKNAGVGILFEIGSMITEFKSNKIKENTAAPMRIPARLMEHIFWDSVIEGGAIQITEGKILSGLENFWPNYAVGYDIIEDLVIYNGSSLVLTVGTKLNMGNDKAIRVISGSVLRILGEANNPVIIEGKNKSKGAWRGIFIENSQMRVSSIGFAEIRHAGSTAIAGQSAATIKLGNGGRLKLFKTTLDEGKGIGLEAAASTMILEMADNTIKNHLSYPISVTAQMVEHLDYLTRFENNGVNEVAVDGFNALAKDGGEIIWKGFAERIPYVVKGLGKDLRIQSGMRIKAGVVIKMQDGSSIDVQDANGRLAYLNIEGAAGNPVIIQGVNDTAGSWYGITYSTNHAQNVINQAIIRNAGKTMSNNFSAAITVDNVPQGSLLLQNTQIIKSGQHGVAITRQFSDFLRTSNLTFESIPGQEIFVWQ
ncbi:MAG: hypothetical protein Q8S14_16210 [Algoriphagus sp.]|uniref:hypothetical protein n=1 Tax=Algoriphagus sp. TaxID=1872435 RepID=UPI00272FB1F2|nr:hypothetical protein [Algoriphagus sp.]MDP2042915.1 hypothetical protein [Algoriphagus sp.]MDP3473412.1 hypothetical protein [Algoriphagus sp.]